MLRDLFVVTSSGIPIYHGHFGECHSINSDADMFSGLITAIQMFCKELGGSNIKHLEMENRNIAFHIKNNILFAIVAETEDSREFVDEKLDKIADLFLHTYDEHLKHFKSNIKPFINFYDYLLENKLVKQNCGKYDSCEICQNHTKSLPLEDCVTAINNFCED
jgi:hypothetical protein